MKEIVVKGVVNTELSPEEWLDKFLGWLESRKESFGGGIHEYKEGKSDV
jgi:hypothetical protein